MQYQNSKDLINPQDNTSDLQHTQNANTHTTPNVIKTKSKTTSNRTPLHCFNKTSSIATFDKTKQIVTDTDKLSHSTTICNRVLQVMNPNGLYKYDTSQQAYLFEHSSKPVNCSHILVILKQSAFYTVNPETHQWYRINTNKISNNHTLQSAMTTQLTWPCCHQLNLLSSMLFKQL